MILPSWPSTRRGALGGAALPDPQPAPAPAAAPPPSGRIHRASEIPELEKARAALVERIERRRSKADSQDAKIRRLNEAIVNREEEHQKLLLDLDAAKRGSGERLVRFEEESRRLEREVAAARAGRVPLTKEHAADESELREIDATLEPLREELRLAAERAGKLEHRTRFAESFEAALAAEEQLSDAILQTWEDALRSGDPSLVEKVRRLREAVDGRRAASKRRFVRCHVGGDVLPLPVEPSCTQERFDSLLGPSPLGAPGVQPGAVTSEVHRIR